MDLLIGMALGLLTVILIVGLPLWIAFRALGRDLDRNGPDAKTLRDIENWREGK